MDRETRVLIGENGNVGVIFHPTHDNAARVIASIGVIEKEARGGYVLPKNPVKRAVFNWLRRRYGGTGLVAAWTRTWKGPWVVRMAATGEESGDYASHNEAMRAEVATIEKYIAGCLLAPLPEQVVKQ